MQITKVSIKNLANLVVGYQYDHKKQAFQFVDVPHPELNQYLKITVEWQEQPLLLPLTDNLYVVGQPFTLHSGFFKAQLMVKDSDGNYIANSHLFNLEVSKSIDPGEKYENIDPNLEIVYDEMKDLINTVNQKLVNGEFNGEDGFSPIVGLNDETDGVVISVTDKDGQKSAKIKHGINGINGQSAYEIAVKNGFKGSKLEWLESLRYDHSDEFQALASKVHKDAEQSSQNAKNAETHATQALESATQANQSKNDAFISAQKAQTAEAHAKTSETNAKESENKAKESAGNAKLSEDNSKQSAQLAQQSAEQIQASAEQIEQNKLDIQDLRNNPVIDETVLEKLAIKDKSQGNPCVIDDSADWRLQDLKAYGQSEQFTTTGKNLLHGTKRVQGYNIMGFINDLKPNTQYTYSNSGITDPKAAFKLTAYNSKNKSEIDLTKGYIRNSKETFTTPENVSDYEELYLAGNYTDAGKNCINNQFQVEEGAVSSPYEPYTGGKPSPSPEYPQEVISKTVSEIKITGNNLIKIEDANKLQNNIYVCREKGFFLTKGIKYVFSFNGQSATALYVVKHGEKDAIHYVYQKNTIEYTPTENGLYYFNIYNQSGVTDEQLNSIRLNIEKDYGYEPYKEQLVTLSSPITLRGVQV